MHGVNFLVYCEELNTLVKVLKSKRSTPEEIANLDVCKIRFEIKFQELLALALCRVGGPNKHYALKAAAVCEEMEPGFIPTLNKLIESLVVYNCNKYFIVFKELEIRLLSENKDIGTPLSMLVMDNINRSKQSLQAFTNDLVVNTNKVKCLYDELTMLLAHDRSNKRLCISKEFEI